MPDDLTTIQVSIKLWRELKDRKDRPEDTFEDVIWDMLDKEENGGSDR